MRINVKSKIGKKNVDAFVVIGNFYKSGFSSFLGNKQNAVLIKNACKYKKDFVVPLDNNYKEIIFYYARKTNEDEMRKLGAKIVKNVVERKLKKIDVLVKGAEQYIGNLVEGMRLGCYSYNKYLSKKPHEISEINLVTDETQIKGESLKNIVKEADEIGIAVNFSRDLVNMPASDLVPDTIGDEAKKMARNCDKLKVKIFGEDKLKKLGLNALLAVGRGSSAETKLIVLEYNGVKSSSENGNETGSAKNVNKNNRPIALIGKGITFDSGGMHLKTGNYINHMKYDMTGAATVMGVFKMICSVKPKVNVVGIIPAAENMIDADVLKPNDIIKTYSGQTVEVTNTDAEGRLVLCDAIAYAAKNYKPGFMVDIATLTGACVTALGYEISAVMGNKQSVIDKIIEAGKKADEKFWQLPLDEDLEEKTKGDVSDLLNYTPGVRAGAIMGGLFLSKFTGKTDWAHIDMGGTAWAESENGYIKKGATGRNVRTLWNLIK